MDVLTISYLVGFLVYTVLTFGWMIHVLMNKKEATRAHYLITLIPFSSWLVYVLTMAVTYSVGGSLSDLSATWNIAVVSFSDINQAVMFLVLSLLASGYRLLPKGMDGNRYIPICVLVFLEVSSQTNKYTSSIVFCIRIFELYLLQQWAKETYAIVVKSPNANLMTGTWACSHSQRMYVANGTKKIILVRILLLVPIIIARLILEILFWIWWFNSDVHSHDVYPHMTEWTIGLQITSIIVGPLFFLFVAWVWRLGTTETYALLPQQAAAPVYGTTTGTVKTAPVIN